MTPLAYFLYGEETFLLKQFIDELRTSQPCEYREFDSTAMTEKLFLEYCTKLSFFNSQEILHFSNILENKELDPDSKALQQVLLSPPPHLLLIFSHLGIPDKRKKLYKLLTRTTLLKEFKPLSSSALQTWIQQYCHKLTGNIHPKAISLLENLVGNNLWQLAKDLEKLCLYVGNRMIVEQDVYTLTTASIKQSVFTLVDYIGYKKQKQAIELLHSLLKHRSDVIPLFSLIVRQIRLLLLYLTMRQNHPNDWKKHILLPPFILQKIQSQARNFSIPELKHIYTRLYTIDTMMKSTTINPIGLLDTLTVELTS